MCPVKSILHKSFQRIQKAGKLPNSIYEASQKNLDNLDTKTR